MIHAVFLAMVLIAALIYTIEALTDGSSKEELANMAPPQQYVCDRCRHTIEARSDDYPPQHRRLASRLFTTLRLAGCRCPYCKTGRFGRLPEAQTQVQVFCPS